MSKKHRQSQVVVEEKSIKVLLQTKGAMKAEFLELILPNSVLYVLTTFKFARKTDESPY